jgi:hypothetical protein
MISRFFQYTGKENSRLREELGGEMTNLLKNILYTLLDFAFRLRNKLRRRFRLLTTAQQVIEGSDSEKTFYLAAIDRILTNPQIFARFRGIHDYREILEHVNYKLGKKYLDKFQSVTEEINHLIPSFKKNDLVGRPRRYRYKSFGLISPTTLRYISVAVEIRNLFGSHLDRVVEIGGGYGGQASILSKMNFYESYEIYDLPEVHELARKFLSEQDITDVTFPGLSDSKSSRYDLVISNYAFSELPRKLQENYIFEVLLKSDRGFLIMNSGRSNKSGRSTGKVSLEEIKLLLPYIEVLEETPKTGPDNYLIVWSLV